MNESTTMPTDYADTVRTHLNKIAKLAPDLDAWVHPSGENGPEQLEAARAVLSAAYHLRGALYQIEHVSQEIVERGHKQQSERMARFFGSEGPESES